MTMNAIFPKRRHTVKKVTNRAFSVLLLILLVVGGMSAYLVNFLNSGSEWALAFYRANSGSTGTIADRNGTVLASFSPTGSFYSENTDIRKACFHIIGDYEGRTGGGIIAAISDDIKDYDIFTGTTHAEDHSFQLTLDSRLNVSAYKAMGSYKGCVLVCNYLTGEMLCILSTPTIDPLETVEDPEPGTYINKALSGAFVPGSVFKLVTSAAAIEDVPGIFEKSFWCENEYYIAGVEITCMGPHYTTDFYSALSNSCNCAFADISVRVGQESLKRHTKEYGFLDTHSLSGLTTAAGNFETEYMGDPELAWAGIGQWTDLVCPYSMLRFVAALANDGILVEPYLFNGTETESVRLVEEGTAKTLQDMMAFNVVDHYGTDNFPGLNLCAKTGTAEVGDGTNNAWFAGFLDDNSHPYAFVVLVEDGGYGISSAGGVANMVLQDAIALN